MQRASACVVPSRKTETSALNRHLFQSICLFWSKRLLLKGSFALVRDGPRCCCSWSDMPAIFDLEARNGITAVDVSVGTRQNRPDGALRCRKRSLFRLKTLSHPKEPSGPSTRQVMVGRSMECCSFSCTLRSYLRENVVGQVLQK